MPVKTLRLGVIVPSANVIMEPDMYRMAPDGVTVHFSRAVITEDSAEQLARLADDVPRCCTELSHGKMDVYAFGCTSGSLYGGAGYDREIIQTMVRLTGKPATTTSTAVLEAFEHLAVKRISVVTPYEDWLNDRVSTYFEDNGIEVVSMIGLGIPDPEGIASQEPDTIFGLVQQADRPQAEAVFISCTDFRGAQVLERIEAELGKPALSSNQATMWKMLDLCDRSESVPGYGRLLAG
jgi:maleate isomerase